MRNSRENILALSNEVIVKTNWAVKVQNSKYSKYVRTENRAELVPASISFLLRWLFLSSPNSHYYLLPQEYGEFLYS